MGVTGLVMILAGIGDLLSSFGTHLLPGKAWLAYVGLPVLGAGVALTVAGLADTITHYGAVEITPLGKRATDRVAKDAPQTDKTFSPATDIIETQGHPPAKQTIIRCHRCDKEMDLDANFCSQCGQAIQKSNLCPGCNRSNEPNARYCKGCGRQLGSAKTDKPKSATPSTDDRRHEIQDLASANEELVTEIGDGPRRSSVLAIMRIIGPLVALGGLLILMVAQQNAAYARSPGAEQTGPSGIWIGLVWLICGVGMAIAGFSDYVRGLSRDLCGDDA